MFTSKTECFTLANGVNVPCVGYGTWQTPDGEVTSDCVRAALELGYRHIDTAFAYGNEKSVGEGIRRSGVARSEIFVTTKHWVTERGYAKTIKAVETSLDLLGLDYVDLYLIHWPCVKKLSPDWKEINADTWRAMETMYRDGKIRAIGVSNFFPEHLDALIAMSEIKPMVNQLEFHPGYTQMENIRYSQSCGLLAEAWSPLGSGAVLADPTLNAIAAKYGKTAAQLCVRFALQCDVLPLPKSTKPERIAANADVFDFAISDEDMRAIAALPQLGFSGFLPEDAPADAIA
jgi:diketogulonate reductase-like aldo/keto reductase